MMPRVHRVKKGGKVFKYHRITRAPLPSDVPEDHPSFIAAWSAQEKGQRPPRAVSGTVAAGCADYLASRSFRDLSDSYRPVIRRHVEAIRKQGESAMLRDLRPHHIEQDIEPLTPAVARSRMKAWRKLGAFWRTKGATQTDISAGLKSKPMPKTDGHREWQQADVDRFRAHWPIGTPQRLAMELLQWTGARISDAIRLGRGMVQSDGVLRFSQTKTKQEASVPWTAPAFGLEAQRRDLMACVADHRQMVFILTKYGKARTVKGASQWFSDAATDAGLADLTAHGLRKYRMNQLAEAGVSVLGMQTWCGHVTLDEVQDYTKRAERRNVFFVNHPRQFTNEVDK
jgi:site-specific recombinase XerD